MRVSTVSDQLSEGYDDLERLIAARVQAATGPLFTTNAENLMDMYLSNVPSERRQHYTCNHCRRFIDRFGGLVRITPEGNAVPIMWEGEPVPQFFQPVAQALSNAVRKAKVTGVFLSSEAVWGVPENVPGPGSKYQGQRWSHLSGQNPSVWTSKVKTADQTMAEKLEDHGILCRSLAEYSIDAIREAVRVLESDALGRSEKAIGIGKWFLALSEMWGTVKGTAKSNRLWLAVATAPPGFCHVKNTVIGTLMDDVVAGMSFDDVSRRWAAKMHPLAYQRPQVLKTGQIEAAEKLIEMLGARASLSRRYATLADVKSVWRPSALKAEEQTDGVFAHLRDKAKDGARSVTPLLLPPKKTSWLKFAFDVLPMANKIELLVPSGPSGFFGLVTATDMGAPPILQWDFAEQRNPVSWYVYVSGSMASNWNLAAGRYTPLTSVSYTPPHWFQPEKFAHHVQGVMLAIEGCRDVRHTVGGGLFPENLRTEFREARSAIEAHSQAAAIVGKEDGNANGLCFRSGTDGWNCNLRVTTGGVVSDFVLDRWE